MGIRPHPEFENWEVPHEYSLGTFGLRALSVDDLERDYSAVIESAADIKAANPSLNWPDGLTREKNLIDLAWHQKEFQTKRSFAWVIEDADGAYLGCLYIYPSIAGDRSADVSWWWRIGANADDREFRAHVLAWVSGSDWPALDFNLPDR